MNIRPNPFVVALCLAGFITAPAFAATQASTTDNNKQIQQLNSETKLLLAEANRLQKRVKRLETQQTSTDPVSTDDPSTDTSTADTTSSITTAVTQGRTHSLAKARAQAQAKLQNSVSGTTNVQNPDIQQKLISRRELASLSAQEREYLPFDLDVPGQAFVSTGPYVGVPIQYAGSNLIINSPSVNTDLQLLGIRKAILEQLQAMGGELKEPYHSHLLLSGVIEGQTNYTNRSGRPSFSYIDVTNVSLDAMILGPSEWLLGFIEFSYDNGPSPSNFYIVSNSRVFVNKAFVTIGDLLKSPLYGTFGQMYVPFGRYSSVMISDPLTKLVARTKARAILLGLQLQGDNALYGSTYVFPGDSRVTSGHHINNGGINIGYKYNYGFLHGDFGGGIIGNLGDSGGMQLGAGLAQSFAAERLEHRVPAYNLRGIFSFGEHVDIITEWITTASSFNKNNISFDGHGAKPSAFDVEGAYSFYMFQWPSAVALGFSRSYQSLALDIPMTRTYLVFNTSIWRNTLQSIELRHDQNYSKHDTANGPVVAQTFPGQCTASACRGFGGSDNAITAQFDYYF